jgi:3-hydroxybutyryl-CoA dehydrogenase
MADEIRQITVIGAGAIGHGIAQVCAQAGFVVIMQDIGHEILDEAVRKIRKNLSRLLDEGRVRQSDVQRELWRAFGRRRT